MAETLLFTAYFAFKFTLLIHLNCYRENNKHLLALKELALKTAHHYILRHLVQYLIKKVLATKFPPKIQLYHFIQMVTRNHKENKTHSTNRGI